MRKSYRFFNMILCICLLTFFFYLGYLIRYPASSYFQGWLSLLAFVALLLATQNLIHVFIGQMQLAHPLTWQIFAVLACDFMWIYLFLSFGSGSIEEALLEMGKMFVGFLIAHSIVFGEYVLTKHLIASK